MKSKKLVIIGTGETGLIAHEYFQYDSNYEVVAFSVSERYITERMINGLPVVELESIEESYPPGEYYAYVAISSGRLNRNRTATFAVVKDKGYECASYISSKSFIWRNVEVGENCFIFEDNTLQPFVKVENNVTLWSGNHVGHNTVIRNNCFISSHCVISGYCEIGENSFLGVNCTIENNTKIARDNFIGSGALIRKDTLARAFYQEPQTELAKIDAYRLFKLEEQE